MTNGCWKTLISNLWAGLNPEPSLVLEHKEVLDQIMCVTTAYFKGILMHKHYNMSMHQYFLCFMTLFGCLLIDYVFWNLCVCFCILSYQLFSLLLLINLFILMCQKSKNHIKSRKSKVWLTLLSFILKLVLSCTFVLMALCIYERSLFPCTLITVEEILKFMWLL